MENPVARAHDEARKVETAASIGIKDIPQDKSDDLEMKPMQVEDAGRSIIYHAKTGVPSLVNNNWLTIKLSHRDKEGDFIWSAKQTVIPKRGTYKCLLHPDQAARDEYDTLGFGICLKSNLTSPYQVTRHAAKRHKDEYNAIAQMRHDMERQEDREKREEDRATTKVMLEAIAGRTDNSVESEESAGTDEAPLYESDKPAQPKKPRRNKK